MPAELSVVLSRPADGVGSFLPLVLSPRPFGLGPLSQDPKHRAHCKAKTWTVSLVDASSQIKEAHNSTRVFRTQQAEQ